MGIQIRWTGSQKNRIHIIFEANWTLTDFQQMVLDVRDKITPQKHPVHVIANFTFSNPLSSSALLGIPFAVNHMAHNFGIAVVVTQDDTINHLAKTAISMHHDLQQRVYIVKNLEMAERVLAHRGKRQKAIAR